MKNNWLIVLLLVIAGLSGCASTNYEAPDGYQPRAISEEERELIPKEMNEVSDRYDVVGEVETVGEPTVVVEQAPPTVKVGEPVEAVGDMDVTAKAVASQTPEVAKTEVAAKVATSVKPPKPTLKVVAPEATLDACTLGSDPVLPLDRVPRTKEEAIEALSDPKVAERWVAVNPQLRRHFDAKSGLRDWAEGHLIDHPFPLPVDIDVPMTGRRTIGDCSLQKGELVWGYLVAAGDQTLVKVVAKAACFNGVGGSYTLNYEKTKLVVVPVSVTVREITTKEVKKQRTIVVRERERFRWDLMVLGAKLNSDDPGSEVSADMIVSIRDLPNNPKANVTVRSPYITASTSVVIEAVGIGSQTGTSAVFALPPPPQGGSSNQVTFRATVRGLVGPDGESHDLSFQREVTYSYTDNVINTSDSLTAGEESDDGTVAPAIEVRGYYSLDTAGKYELFGGVGGVLGDTSSVYGTLGFNLNPSDRFHVNLGAVIDSELDVGATVGLQVDLYRRENAVRGLKAIGLTVQFQKFFDSRTQEVSGVEIGDSSRVMAGVHFSF